MRLHTTEFQKRMWGYIPTMGGGMEAVAMKDSPPDAPPYSS